MTHNDKDSWLSSGRGADQNSGEINGGGALARTYPIHVHVSRDTCTVHVECKAERAHKSQLHVDTHSDM